MIKEEAIKILKRMVKVGIAYDDGYGIEPLTKDENTACKMAIEALAQEPCEDCISRQAVCDTTVCEGISCNECSFNTCEDGQSGCLLKERISKLPSVTPQPNTGHWLRMSDLSEQLDDRYKCSRCGNVVHHTNKMNLYTFNRWCERCGSDNGRKRG